MTESSVPAATGRRALALESDLFFSTKISATLRLLGFQLTTARDVNGFAARLAEGVAVALINISARGIDWQAAIRAARAANVPVVAYGSHVDIEAQSLARTAGATRVIANSKLASNLPEVVERALASSARGDRNAETSGDSADVSHGEDAIRSAQRPTADS